MSDTKAGALASADQIEAAARHLFRAICREHDGGETFPVSVSVCMNALREALGEEYTPVAAKARPVAEGEDDADVWIPPVHDCMGPPPGRVPCPHCSSMRFHHRTNRCGECGRRPTAAADGRRTPARDLGLCNGVDSCEHGRAWNAACERCAAGQLAAVVGLWSSPRGSAGSCRRSVRLVWPELGERLDALADRQDDGDAR